MVYPLIKCICKKCPYSSLRFAFAMPRHTDPVWNNFVKIVTVGKTGSRAKCKSCNKEIQGIVSRLKLHTLSCASKDDDSETDVMVASSTDSSPCSSPQSSISTQLKLTAPSSPLSAISTPLKRQQPSSPVPQSPLPNVNVLTITL